MRVPEVVLSRSAADAVHRGHPWVFREGLSRPPKLETGDQVQLLTADGEPLGRGLYDAGSPLAVRVWTRGRRAIDDGLVRERIAGALALRRTLVASPETTAYRLLHGEGDRLPGFVVDRYADVAVLRLDGDGARAAWALVRGPLEDALRREGIASFVLREAEKGQPPRFVPLFGPDAPKTVVVLEHGVPFVVDLARGQKTGAFLDQRENRRRVGALADGRRVLNLFSYAGGFSLFAAKGGARQVTSVDIAAGAHATAQESFRRAEVDPAKHAFVAADAFAFLERAAKEGKKWDLVVSDPPSFAPSEKAVKKAIAAYRSLHRACVQVLEKGGLFCAASCSSHIDEGLFAATLDDASLGRDDLRILETYGPPADHPTLPAWPEGRYLKFALLG